MSRQDIEHHTAKADGVTLHYVTAGEGKPVILLHGFPEFWYGWRHQIGPLADSGFRVVVPDQRGYNTSDKPKEVSAYNLDTLARDVVGLMDSLGFERAAIVGHDWGGIVAWWVAARHAGRVERLAVLNAPHPTAFWKYIRTSPRQLFKSWYAFFFQLPWLPEAAARRGDWSGLSQALTGTSRPGTFGEADLEEYRKAWSQPGAITAMINWYRAAMRIRPDQSGDARVHVPTLIIWGAKDTALERGLAQAGVELCDRGRVEYIEEATHWVQHEEAGRVNRLLIEFLLDEAGTRSSPTS
jgi:pimeloyl-ACP methyl ester carboxylesterase